MASVTASGQVGPQKDAAVQTKMDSRIVKLNKKLASCRHALSSQTEKTKRITRKYEKLLDKDIKDGEQIKLKNFASSPLK